MRVYLCEKPSQGKDVASVLGATQRGNGCYTGKDILVTWCIGHLVEAVAPEGYDDRFKHWSLAQLPIIPDHWRVAPKPKTAAQFKVVKQAIERASTLIIATDADREGEMIARELIDLCKYRGPIERLWLSALNEASIRRALDALKPSHATLPLYHSALARSRADWLVGMNLTRLFTLLGRQAGHAGVLSVGRVQTPTLALVVNRDRAIQCFVPSPYWAIEVALAHGGAPFVAHWTPPEALCDDAGRCIDKQAALRAARAIGADTHAAVVSVETERVREAPPLPFALSTLQEVCSRQLGLGVQETLDLAQSLYERHKATTYPRSDSGYLPESMFADVGTVIDSLVRSDPSLRHLVSKLDLAQRSRAWNDGKVSAHHGIIPTLEPVDISAMDERELAVYQLIRAYYLAQFLPHHEFDRTVVQLASGGQPLQALGKQIVVRGWRELLTLPVADSTDDSTAPRSQVLPALSGGMRCDIRSLDLQEHKTQPPRAYTQGELLKAMKGIAKFVQDPALKAKLRETTGIGTEATRAAIIKGLLLRGYLRMQRQSIRATESAFALIDAVPPAITDAGTSALWEQALTMIEAGQVTLDSFVAQQAAWVAQLVERYRGTTLALEGPKSPSCPECSGVMRQRMGRQGAFWGCCRYPDCKGTQALETGKANKAAAGRQRGARRTPKRAR